MSEPVWQLSFLVAYSNNHDRRLLAEQLRGLGASKIAQAANGEALMAELVSARPRIVITESRLPGTSGLEFTRQVRAGYKLVNRALSIIVITSTPTQDFIKIAEEAGVDEMLAYPFTPAALAARVEAVLKRPRKFVESATYVGPDRRRRMTDGGDSPLRRRSDLAPECEWETAAAREVLRRQIERFAAEIETGEAKPIRIVSALESAKAVRALALSLGDQHMAAAGGSAIRYLCDIGPTPAYDSNIMRTHLHALLTLTRLGQKDEPVRAELVEGLAALVEHRLRKAKMAASA